MFAENYSKQKKRTADFWNCPYPQKQSPSHCWQPNGTTLEQFKLDFCIN